MLHNVELVVRLREWTMTGHPDVTAAFPGSKRGLNANVGVHRKCEYAYASHVRRETEEVGGRGGRRVTYEGPERLRGGGNST